MSKSISWLPVWAVGTFVVNFFHPEHLFEFVQRFYDVFVLEEDRLDVVFHCVGFLWFFVHFLSLGLILNNYVVRIDTFS